jgi:peptidyl-dipeptidase A
MIASRSRLVLVFAATLTLVAGVLISCSGGGAPTTADADSFIEAAEAELLDSWIKAERAAWVQSNFITDDTEAIAADALAELVAATGRLAKESTRYDGLDLPYDTSRKIGLLKTSLPLAAPGDPASQAEMTKTTT